MTWMMYGLGAITLGAVFLAVYERRTGRKRHKDAGSDPAFNRERAAYTEAERIRAETQIAQPPHGGGIF